MDRVSIDDFDSDFYMVAFVTKQSEERIQNLMQENAIKGNVRTFLNEAYINSEHKETKNSLKFELGEFGNKTYYAVCEKNKNADQQPWCLNKITTDDEDFMSLKKFAWLGDESVFLKDIATLALEEKWTDENLPSTVKENNVLKKHLDVTFSFLYQRGSITYSKKKDWCAFNTGLVDKMYDDIFVIFQKQINKKPDWKYCCCTTKRMSNGKKLDYFQKIPQRANFAEVADLFLVPGTVDSDFEHILRDNFERFPLEFIKRELSPEEDFVKFSEQNFDPESLRDFIIQNEDCMRRISIAFEKTVDQAIRRWNWNYKTAVPIYFPTLNKIQFLLPLYFSGKQNKLDAALVIDKTARQSQYRGVTILTPAMAYLDARLLCRPDSDWLYIEDIDNKSHTEINDVAVSPEDHSSFSHTKNIFIADKLGPYAVQNLRGNLSLPVDGIQKASISKKRLEKKGIVFSSELTGKKFEVQIIEKNPQGNGWILDVIRLLP